MDKFEFQQYIFEAGAGGEKLAYNPFCPKNPKEGKKYPLVLFMHDAGSCSEDILSPLKQGDGATAWAEEEAQRRHPCFVLAPLYPQKAANDEFEVTWEADATVRLVRELIKNYNIDEKRIYGTGQSMGCMMLCELMLRNPGFFAGCFLVAGQWNPDTMDAVKDENIWTLVSEKDIKAFPIMGACMEQVEKAGGRVTRGFLNARDSLDVQNEAVRKIAMSVAVTSCTPHEGKTSVAMEMAKAFAEAGNKTLLIDADMRKSVLVGRYKTGAVKYGMSHCLVGKYKYSEALCQTNIARLFIFFSGPVPPNPSELLGSDRFANMLNVMREAFDYIIIDTPPLGSVIDAAVVAKRCDGTVLVVESNAVNYRFVQKVKEQLDKSGSRILGVVLNKVDLNKKGYYGHYGKYYGRYGYDTPAGQAQPSERRQAGGGGIQRPTGAERSEIIDRLDRMGYPADTEKKTPNVR